jgi:uncharacterized protein
MKTIVLSIVAFLCFITSRPTPAQGIQINRDNKTIVVTVSATVEVDPEIAIVSVGYQNYGLTKDATYKENLRNASKIIASLMQSGLKSENIETQDVELQLAQPKDSETWTVEQKKERQFEADETWNIRVPPSEAEKTVDQAVAAGANEVNSVQWIVADEMALQAKASAAALEKARGLADQMAQKMGNKAGALLFMSNTDPSDNYWLSGGNFSRSVTVNGTAGTPNLKLFPQKVRREATIYAVFSLE